MADIFDRHKNKLTQGVLLTSKDMHMIVEGFHSFCTGAWELYSILAVSQYLLQFSAV